MRVRHRQNVCLTVRNYNSGLILHIDSFGHVLFNLNIQGPAAVLLQNHIAKKKSIFESVLTLFIVRVIFFFSGASSQEVSSYTCCLSVSVLNPVLCSKKQIAQMQIQKGSSFNTLLDVN